MIKYGNQGGALRKVLLASCLVGTSVFSVAAIAKPLSLSPTAVFGVPTPSGPRLLQNGMGGGDGPNPVLAAAQPVNSAPQVVFLDFDSQTNEVSITFDPDDEPPGGMPTDGDPSDDVTITFPDYVYSQADREQVKSGLEQQYGAFNVTFVTEPPAEGDFTTLTFNGDGLGVRAGNQGIITSILFGQAEDIDFRNLNRTDNAGIDGNFWTILPSFVPDLDNSGGVDAADITLAVLRQSTNTAAHELGHILGLRHHDAIGPVGTGLQPGGGNVNPGAFLPGFTGPTDATDTFNNIMASGASVGSPLLASVNSIRSFGERSAVKLTFNEKGLVLHEDDLATVVFDGPVVLPIPLIDAAAFFGGPSFTIPENPAIVESVKELVLKRMEIPNTNPNNTNANNRLLADAVSIIGSLDTPDEVDLYSFYGEAGDIFSFELISLVPSRFLDSLAGQLTIFDEFFNVVDWFGSPATNFCEAESCDSWLFDLILPNSGLFYVSVSTPTNLLNALGAGGLVLGDYELFVYRFIVPEPASAVILLGGLLGFAAMRRRRKKEQ